MAVVILFKESGARGLKLSFAVCKNTQDSLLVPCALKSMRKMVDQKQNTIVKPTKHSKYARLKAKLHP